jgi:hypothetical protein
LVWFPPGEWLHYRGGPSVHGPGFHEVVVPLEHAPLWLRSGSSILLTQPGRRVGDGRYDRLVLALIGGGEVARARVEVPSYGGLAVTVERAAGSLVSVTAPDGLPPIEVVTVGAADTATSVLLNGALVTAGRWPTLPAGA